MRPAGAIAFARIGDTQTELSRRLKINQGLVSKILNGREKPSAAVKKRMLAEYGVDWDAPAPVARPVQQRAPRQQLRNVGRSQDVPTAALLSDVDAVRSEARNMLATVRQLQADTQTDPDMYPEKRAKVLASCATTLVKLGALTGESLSLSEGQIVQSPQFKRVAASLFSALEPFPDALQALTDALRTFE